jgi:hypothetical protein
VSIVFRPVGDLLRESCKDDPCQDLVEELARDLDAQYGARVKQGSPEQRDSVKRRLAVRAHKRLQDGEP